MDKWIKKYEARNKNTSKERLEELSKDSDINVKYRVARNTSASSKMLEELSKDSDVSVRYEVALNTSTSKKVIFILIEDESKEVIEQAVQSIYSRDDFTKEEKEMAFILTGME